MNSFIITRLVYAPPFRKYKCKIDDSILSSDQEEMKKPKYLLNMISIFVPTTTTAF